MISYHRLIAPCGTVHDVEQHDLAIKHGLGGSGRDFTRNTAAMVNQQITPAGVSQAHVGQIKRGSAGATIVVCGIIKHGFTTVDVTSRIEGHEVIPSGWAHEVYLFTNIYRRGSDLLGEVTVVKLQVFCGTASKVCKCCRVDNVHNGAQVAGI
ncbi:MAG: hypothetical protein IME96_08520 [Proteobacteria bacterium]|nr:hypothetical protein [Pseudomonadota bacterium]